MKQEDPDSSEPSAGQLISDIGTARTPQHPKKRRVFDVGFLIVSAIMFAAVGIVYYRNGAQHVLDILAKDSILALDIAPKVLAAVLLAAWLRRILPKEVIARHFGHQSGIRGMSLAVLARRHPARRTNDRLPSGHRLFTWRGAAFVRHNRLPLQLAFA